MKLTVVYQLTQKVGDYYHKTRNNMKKIIIFAALSVLLSSCAVKKEARSHQRRHHDYTVAEYEQKRARLYDASLTFLTLVKNSCERNVNDDWYGIDPVSRDIIENYRVPDLEILLGAIEQLENRPFVELADAYDDELCEYYEALKDYEDLIGEGAL